MGTDVTGDGGHYQIGRVAEEVGLSLRTIRFYEEAGILVPSARSVGGFRLYTDRDVERVRQVKAFKPLGFSVEETREIMGLLDRLEAGESLPEPDRELLTRHFDRAEKEFGERVEQLREALATLRSLRDRAASIDDGPELSTDGSDLP